MASKGKGRAAQKGKSYEKARAGKGSPSDEHFELKSSKVPLGEDSRDEILALIAQLRRSTGVQKPTAEGEGDSEGSEDEAGVSNRQRRKEQIRLKKNLMKQLLEEDKREARATGEGEDANGKSKGSKPDSSHVQVRVFYRDERKPSEKNKGPELIRRGSTDALEEFLDMARKKLQINGKLRTQRRLWVYKKGDKGEPQPALAGTLQHLGSCGYGSYGLPFTLPLGFDGVPCEHLEACARAAEGDALSLKAHAAALDDTTAIYANAWYPLCFTNTTDRSRPHSIEVCGASVVFWHDGSQWRAALDECPHRAARLSEGRIRENGDIECPYHGWSFEGGTGRCSRLPQADAPDRLTEAARACATILPAEERHGLLFAWAAPLFGSAEPPDAASLDAVSCKDVFATPGVKYVDYSRDLPMDLPTVMENVLDPSHLPFTHHDTISKRDKAAPVPIKMEGPPTAKGFRGARVTTAPGAVSFVSPNHVLALTSRPESYRDWNIVYVTPARPGCCRIFVRVVFEVSKIAPPLRFVFEYAFSPALPAFFTHLSNHKVLEDDNIFLHFQGETLAPEGIQDGSWRDRLYMPTSADAAVIHYHRWLEQFSSGGVTWARQRERRLWTNKLELLERLHSHTEHCDSCTRALHTARAVGKLAELAVLLGVLGISLFPDFAWPLAVLTLLSYVVKQACGSLEQQLIVGEYPPPRNKRPIDLLNLG
ncbi:PAO [Symbiodinium natans]|uniref:PAO protein n=1 Tax=Symbiodinium natans TaxID=878477 RepID=A0A812NK86_9DINO|nr:PAO [Symbiodinium natans]